MWNMHQNGNRHNVVTKLFDIKICHTWIRVANDNGNDDNADDDVDDNDGNDDDADDDNADDDPDDDDGDVMTKTCSPRSVHSNLHVRLVTGL